MGKITSSKDFLMLLLNAKGHRGRQAEAIRGRTRLMKMVFLFDKEIRKEFNKIKPVLENKILPDFEPYDFGPFSSQVFEDLEFLIELRFVKPKVVSSKGVQDEEVIEYSYWLSGSASRADDMEEYNEEDFGLTEMGKEFVEAGEAGTLTEKQKNILDEFKGRCTRTPLRSLLRYVYAKYPEQTTESKIRNEILADR